jgi:hypothetical protein
VSLFLEKNLTGNQLSSRSSVLRYVEVLRVGCRSVEVDVWDGADGEPVVKHGYTVTTEILFQAGSRDGAGGFGSWMAFESWKIH